MAVIYRGLLPDGRSYVGSTVRKFSTRLNEHRYYFKVKKYKMYKNINCAFDDIEWSILEECDDGVVWDRENYYIRKFDSIENGLNSGLASKGCVGRFVSESEKFIKKRAREFRMPYFKISYKNNPSYNLISNSYSRASEFTGFSKDTVRKKIKYSHSCKKFNYEYLNGGELSQ